MKTKANIRILLYGVLILSQAAIGNNAIYGECNVLAHFDTPSTVVDIFALGDMVITVEGNGTLTLYNITEPENPSFISSVDLSHSISAAARSGSMIYAAHPDGYLSGINISDPGQPRVMTEVAFPYFITDMAARENFLFCTASYEGIVVVNTINTLNPVVAARLDIQGFARGIAIEGNHAYVALGNDGIVQVDITEPVFPNIKTTYAPARFVLSVEVHGEKVYIANAAAGFDIVDFSTEPEPTSIYTYTASPAFSIKRTNDAFVAFGNSIAVFDTGEEDASPPERRAEYGSLHNIYDAVPYGNYIIASLKDRGWEIVKLDVSRSVLPAGRLDLSEYVYSIAVKDTACYAGVGSEGIRVIDVADPENPSSVGADFQYGAWHVNVSSNRLFQVDERGGVVVNDVENPYLPVLCGQYWGYSGNAISTTIEGERMFLAALYYGMRIVDIVSLEPINLPTPLEFDFSVYDVVVNNDAAYVIDQFEGIFVYDVSSPETPVFVNQLEVLNPQSATISNGYLYVAANEFGVFVYDIAVPFSPAQVGHCDTFFARDIAVVNDATALVADANGGLVVLDITAKDNPRVVSRHRFAPRDTLESLVLSGDYVYLGYGAAGIIIVPLEPLLPKTAATARSWIHYF